jgi:hypothetical protein
VILVLPRERGEQDKFAAAGFTDETRAVWQGLLTLAGVRRWTAWEKRLPLWRKAVNVLAGIFMLPGAFAVSGLVGLIVRGILFALGVPEDVAKTLGFLCVIPGAIYVLLYFISLWPWRAARRVASRRSEAEKRKMQWRGVLCAFGTNGLVAFSMALSDITSPRAKIVGALVLAVSAWFIGRDLGWRWANMEWPTTESDSAPEEPPASQ